MADAWESRASWIWLPEYDDTRKPGNIVLFRKEFDLVDIPSSFPIRVSADSRYRLFLNGQSIGIGPCKGTLLHWHYETFDGKTLLQKGKNVLAAQVLRYSPAFQGNTSIMRAPIPGFILLAESNESIATDETWRCIEDGSIEFLKNPQLDHFLDITEHVVGGQRFFGWELLGFDDTNWRTAKEIVNASPVKEVSTLPWNLQPRTIPHLTEIRKRFAGVERLRATSLDEDKDTLNSSLDRLLREGSPFQIPAKGTLEVDIKAAEYSTGYLEFSFQGGAGAQIDFLCAESYELESRPPWPDSNSIQKGDRTDSANGYLNGEWDKYTVAGSSSGIEKYEPFWFRTFRFVRLSITAAEETLVLKDLSYRETNYPLDVQAYCRAGGSELESYWDISLRTLKNCMHETYEDCPFYEQSQFCFDTRSQMLFTYNVSNDDRLARRAIHDFHTSVRPDGLISMRWPAYTNIALPVFSLFFPLMVHDHIMYYGDMALARRYFPTCDAILEHFSRLVMPNGLVGRLDPRHWAYVDWVKDWVFATPAAARTGPATYFSLVYAYSLEVTSKIADFIGRIDTSREYRARHESLIRAVNTECFDGQWYKDGPVSSCGDTPESISQHCQIYAVLAGVITGQPARDLLLRTIKDQGLHQVSSSQTFYLFRALHKSGMYEVTSTLWGPWKHMVSQHLDTWAENQTDSRSDCHAWSAIPLYEFPCGILGINPAAPGFASAIIQPRLDMLPAASGILCSKKGNISVEWTSPTARARDLNIVVPKSMSITLILPSGDKKTYENTDKIQLSLIL